MALPFSPEARHPWKAVAAFPEIVDRLTRRFGDFAAVDRIESALLNT